MKKIVNSIFIMVVAAMMAACSSDDYVGVVPDDCTALMSIDVPQLAESQKGVDARLLRTFFRVSSPDNCGIDLASKLYLFQTTDGNIGMVARVKDADEVGTWIEKLQQQGVCKGVKEHKGKTFTVMNGSWVAGYDDRALLVMGPVVPAAQPTMMRRMIKMLEETSSIQDTPVFGRLEQMHAPMAFVAQTRALPDQLAPLCSLGVPEGTAANKVMLAATMTEKNGCMIVSGEPFSFDDSVDAAMKKAAKVYRPLKGTFSNQQTSSAVYTIMTNVDGKDLVPLLHGDKQLNGMLAGMSAKVDVESFIGNIDGDMVFAFTSVDGDKENMRMQWNAEFRKDATLLDAESQRWLDDNRQTVAAGTAAMPEKVGQTVKGNRMATIINLSAFTAGGGEEKSLLPINLFKEVDYVIYILK